MSPSIAENQLRRMDIGDLDQVYALEQEIFPTPWTRKSYLFELQENTASQQWVIEIDGQIAAYSVCWALGDEMHIANFAVAPASRRQGLGRRMLSHILQQAAIDGLVSATLEVRAGNLAAQALYAEFGFVEVARRKRYYSDNREDAILMQVPNLTAETA